MYRAMFASCCLHGLLVCYSYSKVASWSKPRFIPTIDNHLRHKLVRDIQANWSIFTKFMLSTRNVDED